MLNNAAANVLVMGAIVLFYIVYSELARLKSRYRKLRDEYALLEQQFNSLDNQRSQVNTGGSLGLRNMLPVKCLADEKPANKQEIAVIMPSADYFTIGEHKTVDFWDNYFLPFDARHHPIAPPLDTEVYWVDYEEFKKYLFRVKVIMHS